MPTYTNQAPAQMAFAHTVHAAAFIAVAIASLVLPATVAMSAPPIEAQRACYGQSDGEACHFHSPRGQVTGACRQVQARLACVPDRVRRQQQQQPEGGRGARQHTAVQAKDLHLFPADSQPPGKNQVTIEIIGDYRVIRSNGIPDHKVGNFPNQGNPHAIQSVNKRWSVPARPKLRGRVTELDLGPFGVARNGIAFDPGAAEWHKGQRNSKWRYEALAGAVPLGVDANHAHVQPDGSYHYHGLPTGLLEALGVRAGEHSPLVGWAGDGFPIYARYGYSDPDNPDSPIVELYSGYNLKNGQRPGGDDPGGRFDGAFVADYEYTGGDLDECNGRETVTPEFPHGSYAYFLTADWPVIPRCFKGTPGAGFGRPR